MTDATTIDLAVLAVIGLVAGWINTVAGAGSLLLLPALIFTGLDASEANATNRLGILATTSAAVLGYRRAGLHVGRRELALTVAAMIGGGIGSFVATLLAPSDMQLAIVIAMGLMLVLSLMPAKKPSAPASEPAATPTATPASTPTAPSSLALPPTTPGMLLAFVAIGIYGGFLQAGVGIVVLLYLSVVHGLPLVASNVVKSTVTLALTVVAIGVFALRGEGIDLVRGGVLALSSAVGGLAGARSTVALGDRFVRVAVAIAVIASMTKLVLDML